MTPYGLLDYQPRIATHDAIRFQIERAVAILERMSDASSGLALSSRKRMKEVISQLHDIDTLADLELRRNLLFRLLVSRINSAELALMARS